MFSWPDELIHFINSHVFKGVSCQGVFAFQLYETLLDITFNRNMHNNFLIKALPIVYLIISKTWVKSEDFGSLYDKVDMCYKVFCVMKM